MIPKLRRIPSFLPETTAYLNTIVLAGGSVSQETLQAIDRFVRDCYNTGVWPKLYEVYPIAGNSLTAALVKLKYASINPTLTAVNMVAADYTERGANGGIAGDGATKYLNTNVSQVGVAASTGHISAYLREPEVVATKYWIGSQTASDNYILGTQNGANTQFMWGGIVRAAVGLNNPVAGFHYGDRPTTSLIEIYHNNVFLAFDNNAVVPTAGAQNFYTHCRNANGTPSNHTAKRLSFFSIGATLSATERTALYNAVQALQTNLQRNV